MKVVYNRRYGGFSLSAEARKWLIARRWRYADKLSEPRYGMVLVGDVPRHDPLLVECVETLGARAGGECAALAIETVERAYEITEYDGNETVHERYVSGYTEEDVAQRVADAVATARAEGAAAEREACLSWIEKVSLTVAKSGPMNAALAHIVATMRAMRDDLREHRARDTTPATLSTDTLAAIAEARGLRLVEPEHLAELEALRAAVDEETALDRERAEHGCGDASCVVERATGMTTNGGCRCGRRALRAALQRARKELAERGSKDGAK